MHPSTAAARTLITDLPTPLDYHPPGTMGADSRILSKLGRGVAASVMTAVVLLCLLLLAVPLYILMLNSILPKVVDVKGPLFFDYRLPEPAATLPLLPPELRSKAYDYAAQEKPLKKFPRVFSLGLQYDVTVRLELPDSEQNIEVGMFQVTVQLLSARGDVVAATTQPAMLRYRSPLVKLARLAAMAIPLVLNFFEERQVLILRMLKGYKEGPVPVIAVRVLLEPSAGRPPGMGLPQVYQAEAEVKTRLTGLVSILYNWRFTSLVWGPFVIFMWEIAVAVLCCPGLVLPGFLRKPAPVSVLPPIAEPVVTTPELEETLLKTGAAVVADLETVDIDPLPKEPNGLERIADDTSPENEELTASESETDAVASGRASVGMGMELGSPHRRKSIRSNGKALSRGHSHPEDEKHVEFENGKWDENMEKALEDILEVHVSPEESEASELSSHEEIDAEMPALEEGEVNKFLDDGANELEPEEVEEVSENVVSAQEEADLLEEDGKASKLKELLNFDAKEGGVSGINGATYWPGSFLDAGALNGGGKTSGVPGKGFGKAFTLGRAPQDFEGASAPKRSLSLDNVKSNHANGVKQHDHAGGEAAAQNPKGRGTNGVDRCDAQPAAGSPRPGAYSRSLVRESNSSGTLSNQSSEKYGTPPVNGQEETSEPQTFANLKSSGKEPDEGEFEDALDMLTPSLSNASMLSALETHEWAELSAEELNGSGRGLDDWGLGEGLEDPSAPGPSEGGIRRRGTGKKWD